jgi:hypothetical protein
MHTSSVRVTCVKCARVAIIAADFWELAFATDSIAYFVSALVVVLTGFIGVFAS